MGMLETYGLLPAIEGLDAAIKSANVSVRSFEYVSGGLITWIVDGEVGAVRVAVAAGKAAASRVGDVVSDHVIARTALDVAEMLPPPQRPGGRKGGTGIHRREFPVKDKKPEPVEPVTVAAPVDTKPEQVQKATKNPAAENISQGELEAMGVHALRKLARQTEGVALSRIEIRDARKDSLVNAIINAWNKARG
jgi:microcompartment protein CcmL/EutN